MEKISNIKQFILQACSVHFSPSQKYANENRIKIYWGALEVP